MAGFPASVEFLVQGFGRACIYVLVKGRGMRMETLLASAACVYCQHSRIYCQRLNVSTTEHLWIAIAVIGGRERAKGENVRRSSQ